MKINPQKYLEKIKEPLNNLSPLDKKRLLKFEIGIFFGFLLWAVINTIFEVVLFIGNIFSASSIMIIYVIAKIIGFDDPDRIINIFELGSTTSEIAHVSNQVTNLGLDMFTTFMEFILFIPKAFQRVFSITFPVLMDINIDIDWLHVEFSYIVRTIFNLLQFIILFYITRKIRNRIKEKVEEKIKIEKYVWFPDLQKS